MIVFFLPLSSLSPRSLPSCGGVDGEMVLSAWRYPPEAESRICRDDDVETPSSRLFDSKAHPELLCLPAKDLWCCSVVLPAWVISRENGVLIHRKELPAPPSLTPDVSLCFCMYYLDTFQQMYLQLILCPLSEYKKPSV